MQNPYGIDLAGKYFSDATDYGFDKLPGFDGEVNLGMGLDYTTAAPPGSEGGALPSSPEGTRNPSNNFIKSFEELGINISTLPPEQQVQVALTGAILRDRDKTESPEELKKKLEMLDEFSYKQALRKQKLGIESNQQAFLLKDLPKYMAAPAWERARYADDIAVGPYAAASIAGRRNYGVPSARDYFKL